MPVTREQAEMLVELAIACRPTGAPVWNRAGIFAAIGKVKGRSLASVTIAVIQAAEDRGAENPGVIASAGPHWRQPIPGDRPNHYPPKAEDMCPIHGGHLASCPGCAADRLTGDKTPRAVRPAPEIATRGAALVRAALHPQEAAVCGEETP